MTATEKELSEARDMQRTMWDEHFSEGSPFCDECEEVAERIAQLERDVFIADIAAMRIWMERNDNCICCGDDSAIDRLIRRARALEGKS